MSDNIYDILASISNLASQSEILIEVGLAMSECELLDSHQVAKRLGVSNASVRKRAKYHDIGQMVGRMGRVYTPSDVEALRATIGPSPGPKTGPQPETLEMIAKMRVMRKHHLTLAQIGREFDVSESYVCQLLKGTKDE